MFRGSAPSPGASEVSPHAAVQRSDEGQGLSVTGATSGIGKATAAGLAAQGATVVLGCRSREKGEAVRQEIARATGSSSLDLMVADLASIEFTKRGAADFLARRAVRPEGLR
jgi:short-subunit dehydrogenase